MYSRGRRPFWLPASNYYILAAALGIAFFFLLWGILHEGGDEMPWIPAGLGTSFILVGAVILREIVLRKARHRFLLAQKRLDANLNNAVIRAKAEENQAKKLSLEKNALIVRQIQKKSEAAKVLMKLPEGHFEVFAMCNEYLEINKVELENIGLGSPRLAALRRSRELVVEMHRFHLLTWTEIESRLLTQEAKNRVTMSERIETAQRALEVIKTALQFYPNERRLLESEDAVREFVISIKISHSVEQAEKAVFKGHYKRAISRYKDVLFFLARENWQNPEIELMAEKIKVEIDKLKELSEKNKKLKKPDKEY